MGIEVAERGTGEDEATGVVARGTHLDESARDAVGLRVTEDRVLIRADRDDHAPTQTEAGLYLASSLAAAVEGNDTGDSWFVGTVVQTGPLVNVRDCRRTLTLWLLEMEEEGHDVTLKEVQTLRARVEEMSVDMPDPVKVGDHVAFSWAAGQQIVVDGDRFVILRASDVLAVLEES